MRHTWKVITRSIIALPLTCFALSSCSMDKEGILPDYGISGPPTAEYILKGQVMANDNGSSYPIEGIEVVFVNMEGLDYEGCQGDTIYTDAKGRFELSSVRYPSSNFRIKFTDNRGNRTNKFKDYKEELNYDKCDFNKGFGPFLGVNVLNLGKISLNPGS